MFGLSTWEVLLILVVALIFIGPDQLPKVARKLGDGMRQVRGAMTRVDDEVRRTIREATAEEAVAEEEARRREAEARAEAAASVAGANAEPATLPTLAAETPPVETSDGAASTEPARKAPPRAVARKNPFPNAIGGSTGPDADGAKAGDEPPAAPGTPS